MHRRDERGAGTLLTAGACASLLVVAWMASVLVAWLAQSSSVQDSADLASLAGASAHAQGVDACNAAAEVAARNGSEVVECRVQGDRWSFVVGVRVGQQLHPSLPGNSRLLEAEASAGTIQ